MSRRKKRNGLPDPESLLKDDFCKCGEPFKVSDLRSRYGTTKREAEEVLEALVQEGKLRKVEDLGGPPGNRYTDFYVIHRPMRDLLRRPLR